MALTAPCRPDSSLTSSTQVAQCTIACSSGLQSGTCGNHLWRSFWEALSIASEIAPPDSELAMPLRNTPSRYGSVSQTLHWLTVALVIALLLSGKFTEIEADHPGDMPFLWHGSLGVLVLVVVLSRIVWAFVSPAPPLPRTMKRVVRLGARTTHLALYVLLVALPLSGWLAASSEGASVDFFGVVSIPSWELSNARAAPAAAEAAGAQASDERSEEFFEKSHEVLGNALLILASFHALVALKHHFLDRDDVLKRMLPQSKLPRPP